MRPGPLTADDIRVAEDFDERSSTGLPRSTGFLTPDRDDKFIVIATKGFGKTLLLKASGSSTSEKPIGVSSAGNLLDKPIGYKIFGREALGFFRASALPCRSSGSRPSRSRPLKHATR